MYRSFWGNYGRPEGGAMGGNMGLNDSMQGIFGGGFQGMQPRGGRRYFGRPMPMQQQPGGPSDQGMNLPGTGGLDPAVQPTTMPNEKMASDLVRGVMGGNMGLRTGGLEPMPGQSDLQKIAATAPGNMGVMQPDNTAMPGEQRPANPMFYQRPPTNDMANTLSPSDQVNAGQAAAPPRYDYGYNPGDQGYNNGQQPGMGVNQPQPLAGTGGQDPLSMNNPLLGRRGASTNRF